MSIEAKIERMPEYRDLASRMRRQVASLTEQHPDQWVAIVPAVGPVGNCSQPALWTNSCGLWTK